MFYIFHKTINLIDNNSLIYSLTHPCIAASATADPDLGDAIKKA